MAAGPVCCWVLVLVLVVAVAPAPQGVNAAPSNGSLNCAEEQDGYLGMGSQCQCDLGCDAELNLICVQGKCTCQPDTVLFNQTCLLKSHYQEPCMIDAQCQDSHQWCDLTSGSCACQQGFRETVDYDPFPGTICRPAEDRGRLGENCTTVADCNWRLEHVTCPPDLHACLCQPFYYGDTSGLECRERDEPIDWGWWVAISLISAAVIATGLALIITCTVRECYRSHRRARGRVITLVGPLGEESRPPPPYIAVLNSKAPTTAPQTAASCMDNYGFTTCELEPYPAKKH